MGTAIIPHDNPMPILDPDNQDFNLADTPSTRCVFGHVERLRYLDHRQFAVLSRDIQVCKSPPSHFLRQFARVIVALLLSRTIVNRTGLLLQRPDR